MPQPSLGPTLGYKCDQCVKRAAAPETAWPLGAVPTQVQSMDPPPPLPSREAPKHSLITPRPQAAGTGEAMVTHQEQETEQAVAGRWHGS